MPQVIAGPPEIINLDSEFNIAQVRAAGVLLNNFFTRLNRLPKRSQRLLKQKPTIAAGAALAKKMKKFYD